MPRPLGHACNNAGFTFSKSSVRARPFRTYLPCSILPQANPGMSKPTRKARVNAVTKAPFITGRYPFRSPEAGKYLGLPERWHGKRFPFAYRRTGMGREGGKPCCWRDGTGVHDFSTVPYHGTGREQMGNLVGYIVGKSIGNIVGKSVGNTVENRSGT